jgi:hypothetical protein
MQQSQPPSSVIVVHHGPGGNNNNNSNNNNKLATRRKTNVTESQSLPQSSTAWKTVGTTTNEDGTSIIRNRRLSSTGSILPPNQGRRTSSVEMGDVYKREEETIFEITNPLNTPSTAGSSTSTTLNSIPGGDSNTNHTSTALLHSLSKFDGSITSKEFLARKSIRHHGSNSTGSPNPHRRASLFDVVRDASTTTDDERSTATEYPTTPISPRATKAPNNNTTTITTTALPPPSSSLLTITNNNSVHTTPIIQHSTKLVPNNTNNMNPANAPLTLSGDKNTTTTTLSLSSPPPLPARPLHKRRPESIEMQAVRSTTTSNTSPASGDTSPSSDNGATRSNHRASNRKSSLLLGKIFSSPLWDKRKSVSATTAVTATTTSTTNHYNNITPPSPLQLTPNASPVVGNNNIANPNNNNNSNKRPSTTLSTFNNGNPYPLTTTSSSSSSNNTSKRISLLGDPATVESMLLSHEIDDDTIRAQSIARTNLRERRKHQRDRYLARLAAEQAEIDGKPPNTLVRKVSSYKDTKMQNIKELCRFFQKLASLHKKFFLLPTSKDANLQYCDKRATYLLGKYQVEDLIEPLIRLYHSLPDRWESYDPELEEEILSITKTKRPTDRHSLVMDEDYLNKNLALMGEHDIIYTAQITRFSNAQQRQQQRQYETTVSTTTTTNTNNRNDEGLLSYPPDI